MNISIDSRTAVIAIAVFIVVTGLSFMIGTELFDHKEQQKFQAFPNITASSSNNIATASFDNNTLDIMYEDSDSFKAYLDLDRDGSFDVRLDNLTHDGKEHDISEIVTLGNRSYRLYFRYKDSSAESGDGYINLYRILEM